MQPVVRAQGVVKRWGQTIALGGVDLVIRPGVTGLLGANGAGKTTLLGLVLGLHRADAGTLEVLGLDPARLGPDVRAKVGYSPEHHALPDDVRAFDLVAHLAEVHGLPRRAATGRASDTLFEVGLGEERFRPVGTMSTGQRQRVKLAGALAHDPDLLLLDEPTDGLDPVQRDDMLRLIRRVGTEFGVSVVLSSHLLDEVERICDDVVILGEGQVVAAGGLDELRAGADGLVVDVIGADAAAALAAHLRGRGLEVVLDASRLEITPGGIGPADHVRDAAVELGIPLLRVQARRITLEDVFLSAGTGAPGGPAPTPGEIAEDLT